jgi:hypothetical protein
MYVRKYKPLSLKMNARLKSESTISLQKEQEAGKVESNVPLMAEELHNYRVQY